MALFTVDPKNIYGKFIEEAGTYNVKVLNSSKYGESSNGSPMATLDFEVIDGKYAGSKLLYNNSTWVDYDEEHRKQSIKRFNTILVAAGVGEGTPIDSIQQIVSGLKGKQMNISVDWVLNEYQGKSNYRLEVKSYSPYDPEGSKPNGKTRPDTNATSTNKQSNSSDPFADSSQSINISDDDLPF